MSGRKKPVKYYSPKRRSIYSRGEAINCLDVFNRDQWVCQLCHKKINPHVRYPSWWCATLDHKTPLKVCLEQNWPPEMIHTLDNVQTAHLRCNMLKGDGVVQ